MGRDGSYACFLNSINELRQRIALLETELKYMNRDHDRMLMNDDGM